MVANLDQSFLSGIYMGAGLLVSIGLFALAYLILWGLSVLARLAWLRLYDLLDNLVYSIQNRLILIMEKELRNRGVSYFKCFWDPLPFRDKRKAYKEMMVEEDYEYQFNKPLLDKNCMEKGLVEKYFVDNSR